jgi:chemotaxis protein CheC
MSGDSKDHAPMTIGHLTPLTELERDALGEVSNIAMARAANSLRQMVEHEVLLSVPATQLVAKPDNPNLVAVRQDFSGAFAGRALLIFPEANSLELVRAVVGRQLPLEDIVDLEDEALAETGNILLNSWVATIANLLKRGLRMSLPVVVRGDSRHMFETGETPERLVLFLHIRFEISKKEIRGYVALLMDIPSMDELRLSSPISSRASPRAAWIRVLSNLRPERIAARSSTNPASAINSRRHIDGTNPHKPRMRAIRALPGQDYRPSRVTGEITIQSDDFALIAELVALDGFRMARRTGKLDVLTCVDDADGTDTHRRGTARTQRKKRTCFRSYRLRLHVPSQQR